MTKLYHKLSFVNKIRILMLIVIIPLVTLVIYVMSILLEYSGKYDSIVENVTIASEFSFDFQPSIDEKTYLFIVYGKKQEEYDFFNDINSARSLINRLNITTTNVNSKEKLRMVGKFLDNLEKAINNLSNSDEGYDADMLKLEGIIRPNSELVSDWVHQYIYSESVTLAEMREETRKDVQGTIFSISVIVTILVLVLIIFSLGMASSISKPLKKLSKNFKTVGQGDFTVHKLETYNDEIQMLDNSFRTMVEQISVLMEDIKTEQENLRSTELKLLQAQINPHFLYNTLDAIVWLAEDNQSEEIVKMVTSLSTFFRTSLSRGEDFIPIREEVKHIRSYLEIQEFRYRDILSYEVNIAPEILERCIPKLTLQPLIENALYHGVKNKRHGGKIDVLGFLEGNHIIIKVIDNGIGMEPEKLKKLRTSLLSDGKVGYGLVNVYHRLKLFYEKECSIEINSEKNNGTEVIIKILKSKIVNY